MPTIVALVKHVPDTWSTKQLEADYTLDRHSVDGVIDEVNEYSMEAALRAKEANPGATVTAVTMGPADADATLRKALAMGADAAVHLRDDALAGSDIIGTAWALSRVIAQLDDVVLVVTGNRASDAQTGALAGALSEYLGMRALTELSGVAVQLDAGTVSGTRIDAAGTWELQAAVPAVVSVTDKADKPRYPNFKGLMAAKKATVTVLDCAAVGIDPAQVGAHAAPTTVLRAVERPARSAGDVIDSGTAADKAAAVVEFLARKNLI